MSDTTHRDLLPKYTVGQKITVEGRKLIIQVVELSFRGAILYVRKCRGMKTQLVTHYWNLDGSRLMAPHYSEINW
jgi:hypothetical protein